MQERVTYQTNRLDLMSRRWLGSDDDETRAKFIRWNFDFFRYSPTFWLPVGRLFWITPPLVESREVLAAAGEAIAFLDQGHRVLIGLPPAVES